ncbi:hypothetical protein GVAV_001181 [Gurleya vavrai]
MDSLHWKSTNEEGLIDRIFEVNTQKYFSLYLSPNGIFVCKLNDKESKYKFINCVINTKIKANKKFIEINNEDFSLPFNFKIIELVEFENYKDYFAIFLQI